MKKRPNKKKVIKMSAAPTPVELSDFTSSGGSIENHFFASNDCGSNLPSNIENDKVMHRSYNSFLII